MKKRLLDFLSQRAVYTVLFMSIQVGMMVVAFLLFEGQIAYFQTMCIVLSLLSGLYMISGNTNPAYKIAWLILFAVFPIFGGLLYLMFGQHRGLGNRGLELRSVMEKLSQNSADTDLTRLKQEDPEAAIHANYILNQSGLLPYSHTETTYLSCGEDMQAAMLRELEKAEHFIFLEYFIIREGKMWDPILEILERKARQGVDVRVIYDDFGCMMTLPANYHRELERRGIRCCVFNRIRTVLTPKFNNRDHRKICVIDGIVGFTGGLNLADEYINAQVRCGHWKDTAILLRGQAVWNLTVMFLSMWDYIRRTRSNYLLYRPDPIAVAKIQASGYVQPFTDIPKDDSLIGETVYLNLINRAKRYVYITTPYLIIDNEMMTALRTAAFSGIDVRLITPHIPDKRYVHALTRSYYGPLLEAGVRIFEYTPGFIHAKTVVSDDLYAVVGTINLDFRSLYLHHECAAWMYGTRAVEQIRTDFFRTQAVSTEETVKEHQKYVRFRKLYLSILRLFSPLM